MDKVLVCPVCGSTDLYYEAGGISGTYVCKNCGYRGSLVIEKDIIPQTKEKPS